jgi:hypothetical protein
MSAISSSPSMPMSSSRPMKGEMKVAPALAASSAWLAEKQSVTLTIRPSSAKTLQARSPSQVSGTLMAMLPAMAASAALLDHRVGLRRGDLGGDRAGDDVADLCDGDLDDVAARFQDQRRVGGDAVDHAGSASSRMAAVSAVSTKNFMGARVLQRGRRLPARKRIAAGPGGSSTLGARAAAKPRGVA